MRERERHEPARTADGEPPDSGEVPIRPRARRLSGLVATPAARRIALTRLAWAVLGLLAALALMITLGTTARRAVVAWVHGLPAYRLDFGAITLDPPPPSWFSGGSAAFLRKVAASAKGPESLSVLDADPEALADDFRHFAWVRRVARVEKQHPNRLVVRLEYRAPVAYWLVDLAKGKDSPRVYIDGDGVILPPGDIRLESAAVPLIDLRNGLGSDAVMPPADPHYGEAWKVVDPADDLPRPNREVAGAARLAAFLRARTAEDRIPALRAVAIHCYSGRKYYVEFAAGAMVYWYEPPGDEPPDRPTAPQKWEMLRDRARSLGSLGVRPPLYLAFTRSGIEVRGEPESPRR